MTRREYTDRVVACLRGPTKAELEAIRTELDAHIEDHICALLDLGYDEALAEERTMALMGDPEEVGRELDKQYPLRWLVIGDLAVFLSVLLSLLLVFFLTVGEPSMAKALRERWQPTPIQVLTSIAAEEPCDLRYSMGDDVIRVYQVYVGEQDGQRLAVINVDCFDRIPLGTAALWLNDAVLENQRGEAGGNCWESGVWARWYSHWLRRECLGVPVEPGDTYVTFRCERLGHALEFQIPLPKETAP